MTYFAKTLIALSLVGGLAACEHQDDAMMEKDDAMTEDTMMEGEMMKGEDAMMEGEMAK